MGKPIEKFIKDTGLTIEAKSVETRRDASAFDGMLHFDVKIMRGEREVWAGDYSVGKGFVHDWVKNHPKKETWDGLPSSGARSITLHQEAVLKSATQAFKKAAPISVAGVLENLVSEAQTSDQPFADWAAEYGYSDDSISAKKIWETVNDTRRKLNKAFTPEEMSRLEEIVTYDGDPTSEYNNTDPDDNISI